MDQSLAAAVQDNEINKDPSDPGQSDADNTKNSDPDNEKPLDPENREPSEQQAASLETQPPTDSLGKHTCVRVCRRCEVCVMSQKSDSRGII